MNHRVQPIIAVLIALGAFGFLYVLVTNPGEMAKMAVTVIVAGIIIYFIVKYVMNRNRAAKEQPSKKRRNNHGAG